MISIKRRYDITSFPSGTGNAILKHNCLKAGYNYTIFGSYVFYIFSNCWLILWLVSGPKSSEFKPDRRIKI